MEVGEREAAFVAVSERDRASEGEPRDVRVAEGSPEGEGVPEPPLLSECAGEGVRPPLAVRCAVEEPEGAPLLVPPRGCSVGKGAREPTTLAGELEGAAVPVPRAAWAVGKGAREPSTLAAVGVRLPERDPAGEALLERETRADGVTDVEADSLREGALEVEARGDTDAEREGAGVWVERRLREAGKVTVPDCAAVALRALLGDSVSPGDAELLPEGARTVAVALLARVREARGEAVMEPPIAFAVG